MRGDRLLYLAFLRGDSFAELDDECRMVSGFSEKALRRYMKRLSEKPRTHYRHRFDHRGVRWLCGWGRVTCNKDHVTCRKCLVYVDKISHWRTGTERAMRAWAW